MYVCRLTSKVLVTIILILRMYRVAQKELIYKYVYVMDKVLIIIIERLYLYKCERRKMSLFDGR